MKIIGLQAENFKRLTAIDLKLEGKNLILGGANESGKSSVLDAIFVALGGASALKMLKIKMPVKLGESKATLKLNTGELYIIRTFDCDGTTKLTVTNKEGFQPKSPQAMLDTIMGQLFDPFEFSKMKDSEQRDVVLRITGLGEKLDEISSKRKSIFDERTIINREVARLEGSLASIPKIPNETPDSEVAGSEILKEQSKAMTIKVANDEKRKELDKIVEKFQNETQKKEKLTLQQSQISEKIDLLHKQIEELVQVRSDLEIDVNDIDNEISNLKKCGKDVKAEIDLLQDPDMSVFQTRLTSIEEINKMVREKQRKARCIFDRDEAKSKSDELTTCIKLLDKDKDNLIKKAKFPIDGLGFNEDGVTFKGIAFSQCSTEERIRVGMAIAMAMSPQLKVIRISDGSLLDDNNFKIIQEMAGDDYQLLIEKVGNPGETGIIIENGQIK